MDAIRFIKTQVEASGLEQVSAEPGGQGEEVISAEKAKATRTLLLRPVNDFFNELNAMNFVSEDGQRLEVERLEGPYTETLVLYLSDGHDAPSPRVQLCIIDVDSREALPFLYCFDDQPDEKRFKQADEMLLAFARDFVAEVKPKAAGPTSGTEAMHEDPAPFSAPSLERLIKAG